MNVLLIALPFSAHQAYISGFGLAEPLALELLAANLGEHHVRILDMRLDHDLRRALDDFQPDVVGAGAFVTEVATAKRICRAVKAWNPEALTVVGGHHASLVPSDLVDPGIDVIVVGEGEITLRELVRAHERKGDLRQVAGLALKQDGQGLVFTGERPLLDLDKMPSPARNLVAQNRQRYFRGLWRPVASVSSERGCPFRCHFCSMWKVNRGRYRVRSPAAVVEEIAALPTQYVDFVDDNTLHDVRRAALISELVKQSGLRKTYKAYARSDTVVQHPDLIAKWREMGMKLVLIGLESFKDEDLGFYGKHNTVSNNEEAIRILHANDVEIAAYFVINPNYTRDDFRALSEYVEKWNLTQPVFTVLTPFPGTDFYESVRERLLTDDYELFDFSHAVLPTALPLDEFQKNFFELWRRAYSFGNCVRKMRRGEGSLSLAQIMGFRRFMRGLKSFAAQPIAAPGALGKGAV